MRQEIEIKNTEDYAKALEVLLENGQIVRSGTTNRRIVVWPISLELLNRNGVPYDLVQGAS